MQQAGRGCRLAQRIARIPRSSLAQSSSCRLPAGPLGFQVPVPNRLPLSWTSARLPALPVTSPRVWHGGNSWSQALHPPIW